MVGLETHRLSVAHSGLPVLKDVSIALDAGSVCALAGPNGAGKSTLLRAIAGLQHASGTVAIDGHQAGIASRRELVTYMPQDISASSTLTVIEVVLLGRLRSLGLRLPPELVAEAGTMLTRFGIGALAGRTLDAISGGQRQLVFLAQALFRRPRVLLLDEPTAALDLRHQLIVLETVRLVARRDGIVVVVAMHDLSLAARFSDTFIMLAGGRVDAAGPDSSILTPDRLARVYGVEAEVIAGPDGIPWVAAIRAVGTGRQER